ncbi:MAG: osmotically inducible lipoprotein OsmB [Giesbergeria sp.]
MQSRTFVLATALAAAFGLGACSSNPTNAQVGTGVGAVVGGLAGNAVLGTGGAIAGAAGGALIGHELGEDRDQRRR